MMYYLNRFEGSKEFIFDLKQIPAGSLREICKPEVLETIKSREEFFTLILAEDHLTASSGQFVSVEMGELRNGDKVAPSSGDVVIHSSGKYGVGCVMGTSYEGRKKMYQLLLYKLPEIEFSKIREFRRTPA